MFHASPRLLRICCLLSLFAVAETNADDWARFRGPNGAGVSEVEVPVKWNASENVKWKTALPGSGASSPIVVGQRVFLTCYSGYGLDRGNPGDLNSLKRHVICVDRGTGAILWDKQIDTVDGEDEYTGIGVPAHGYASHTPVSDGKHVFAFLGKSGVVAFDLEGNQIWQVSVGTGSDDRRWGSGSSPILYENLVIVPAIAESVAIIALDKTTGVEVWRQEADGLRSCWGTPAIVKSGDENDLVIAVPGEIWGLNPENGKLRWLSTGAPGDSCYTSVAVDNSGTIFASAGGRSGGGSVAVKGGGTGDVSETHLIWENRDQAGFGSPIVANDTMFLFSRGIATLVDAKTGKQINKLRLKADSDPAPAEENSEDRPRGGRGGGGMSGDYASPVIANGKLYYIKSNGETFVFSADPEFKQLAVNRLTDDDETFSGTPAISDSQLFLRSDKHLYCIDTNK